MNLRACVPFYPILASLPLHSTPLLSFLSSFPPFFLFISFPSPYFLLPSTFSACIISSPPPSLIPLSHLLSFLFSSNFIHFSPPSPPLSYLLSSFLLISSLLYSYLIFSLLRSFPVLCSSHLLLSVPFLSIAPIFQSSPLLSSPILSSPILSSRVLCDGSGD